MVHEPVLVSWSGGKDSSLALERLLGDARYDVVALLTTVTEGYDRISMHGVRRALLKEQAAAIGLPVVEASMLPAASCEAYQVGFADAVARARAEWPDLKRIAFGDLFLADIRAFRERQLAALDMECLFPLWGESTDALARDFIDRGYRAVLVCVDPQQVSKDLAGRDYDHDLLADLPVGRDACGENGEFHTFVTAGPIFRQPVEIRRGDVVERDGFVFADLLSAEAVSPVGHPSPAAYPRVRR